MIAIVAALVFGLGTPASAQAPTSRLVVEARDSSGAVLAGAGVVVAQPSTDLTRRGTTTADGRVVFTALPPGTYTLIASLNGFKTEIIREIRIASGIDATLRLVLEPGPISEQVIVTADAATLRLGTSAVGHVFDRETIGTLPLNERDVLSVTTHAAGMSPPAPGSRLSTQGNSGVNSSGAREAVQQLPDRRLRQQRPLHRPAGDQPEPRRDPGNLVAAEHLRRGAWPQLGRARERDLALGIAGLARVALRLPARLRARRAQPAAAAGRTTAIVCAPGVRRLAWRTDWPPVVIPVRKRRGHPRARDRTPVGARAGYGRTPRGLHARAA